MRNRITWEAKRVAMQAVDCEDMPRPKQCGKQVALRTDTGPHAEVRFGVQGLLLVPASMRRTGIGMPGTTGNCDGAANRLIHARERNPFRLTAIPRVGYALQESMLIP